MNAAEFTRLVEHPALLNDISTSDLREVASRYPYCASAHLLLLKKYKVEKHHDFDARLTLTAAYANDRKALYRLLYDDSKFRSVEETKEMESPAERISAEIQLGNETGAFSDYTPKNQVAEVESFETIEFDRNSWSEGMQVLEQESTNHLTLELEKQFALANEVAGGGAEINHDFDNLEEENEDELLDEKTEVELESTKSLEDAIENAVEENEYLEQAPLSTSGAEITHAFDNLAEENENELVDEHLDAELESTVALEGAIEHAVAEPDYEKLSAGVSQNGFGKHEENVIEEPQFDNQDINIDSSKQESSIYPQESDIETIIEFESEIEVDEKEVEELAEPENIESTEISPELTPRQETNIPIAEEDLVGISYPEAVKEVKEAEELAHEQSHQAVSNEPVVSFEGSRGFTDWLKLLQNKTKDNQSHQDEPVHNQVQTEVPPRRSAPKAATLEHEIADQLYDKEWQAKRLELESWTAGLSDEIKVIDEFVAEHKESGEIKNLPNVAELARRSLEETSLILTETLARVYASQGKYKKAAEMAEKLMLINPSKSAYFADLLEEFKKKITP